MSDARFDEIMHRLRERQHRLTVIPVREQLVAALDGLNVWDALTDAKDAAPQSLIAQGPLTFHRQHGDQSVTGTVIWCRERGYGGHAQIVLVGVWAMQTSNGIEVITGTKLLTYTASHFNAEAYHKLIRKDYRAYYPDDALPPSVEQRLGNFQYDAAQRLNHRKAIRSALIDHMRTSSAR